MAFKSNLNNVLDSYKEAKKEALNNIGILGTAEAQLRATVLTGNMRRSTTFDILNENEVDIGTTSEAPYAVYVEKGSSKQKAQPFIEPAIMDNAKKIGDITGQALKVKMG
jgi:HK97 gp10 family phage protein